MKKVSDLGLTHIFLPFDTELCECSLKHLRHEMFEGTYSGYFAITFGRVIICYNRCTSVPHILEQV